MQNLFYTFIFSYSSAKIIDISQFFTELKSSIDYHIFMDSRVFAANF